MLYREDLDLLECEHCKREKEGGLALHSNCHPAAPTWVIYENGVLTIRCDVCDEVVTQIAVKERTRETPKA